MLKRRAEREEERRKRSEEVFEAFQSTPEAVKYLKDNYRNQISLFKKHTEDLRELNEQENLLDTAIETFDKYKENLPE